MRGDISLEGTWMGSTYGCLPLIFCDGAGRVGQNAETDVGGMVLDRRLNPGTEEAGRA